MIEQRGDTSRSQRIAVLTGVFALHAFVLALVLLQRERAATKVEVTPMAMISIAAERPAASKPPPPALPTKVAKTFKPIIKISVPAEAESVMPSGAWSACATISVVLASLVADPSTPVALRAAPPESRSIAGAVMMWNEDWVPAASSPEAPLWSVRAKLEETLATVNDACLDEVLVGPRLLPIPEADGNNLFVVVGSGNWTWRRMLLSKGASDAQNVMTSRDRAERPAP